MAEDSRVLIIRHLPSELSRDDKENLLRHFGAEQIRCFGNTGRMKHVAFATFDDHESATTALKRLHQLSVLGSRLSVEFSKTQLENFEPSELGPVPRKPAKEQDSGNLSKPKEDLVKKKRSELNRELNCVSGRWGVDYSHNAKLHYRYPPPTVSILTNVANALASVPRFYVQVLHLMNKMNLPAPFGPVTPTPPIPEGSRPETATAEHKSSSEESELESDEAESLEPKARKERATRKRTVQDQPARQRVKVPKILPNVTGVRMEPTMNNMTKPSDLFEQPQASAGLQKKIELKLPAAISQTFEAMQQQQQQQQQQIPVEQMTEASVPQDLLALVEQQQQQQEQPKIQQAATKPAEEGFGKLQPVVQEKDDSHSTDEEEDWGETEFISSRQLRKGILSRSERRELGVFKNYNAGEPTTRLYIKNLSKQTTEKDLHYVFGRYVNWEDETEKLMFDIRLMKEGRMKGQAFVTLPNDRSAKEAVEDTNAFVFKDKPMVVQFARSAKAKKTDTAGK